LAQVPSGEPVSAFVQPWQVPLHVMLQQTPLAHTPLVHWSAAVHDVPLAALGAQVVPWQ
jgi:hypothetical protein